MSAASFRMSTLSMKNSKTKSHDHLEKLVTTDRSSKKSRFSSSKLLKKDTKAIQLFIESLSRSLSAKTPLPRSPIFKYLTSLQPFFDDLRKSLVTGKKLTDIGKDKKPIESLQKEIESLKEEVGISCDKLEKTLQNANKKGQLMVTDNIHGLGDCTNKTIRLIKYLQNELDHLRSNRHEDPVSDKIANRVKLLKAKKACYSFYFRNIEKGTEDGKQFVNGIVNSVAKPRRSLKTYVQAVIFTLRIQKKQCFTLGTIETSKNIWKVFM